MKPAPAKSVVELAHYLLDRGKPDYRFLAYELVAHHQGALRSLGPVELERLGRGIDSWESVDTFGIYLSGPVWRERQVPDRLIRRWARSDDRWWRRAALVSTVPLNMKSRRGKGDPERTLAVCEILIADRDDMVVKALSWALRELAEREPARVRAFIRSHEPELPARALREVRNKLKTGLKNPRTTRQARRKA